ncbi:MAG: transcriptional regulator [Deltaproteobacteria bacterium]|jgi:predicted transcriptional regulator of viral defense system|nr:transcriptional regulator [Deltaproteobacteria bacterium]
MKHYDFFLKRPVFTGEELEQYLASEGKEGGLAKETILANHLKKGRIVRVSSGLFFVTPKKTESRPYMVDPFLIAGKLTPDAVLSHHSALEFYGFGYSIFFHIYYSASRPISPLRFNSQLIRGTKFPKALLEAEKVHYGVITENRYGLELRVTCLERALVDMLHYPAFGGSWDEIWLSLETLDSSDIDLDKVVEYTLLLGRASTAAKVGFFLEQHRELFMVEEPYLKALKELRPKRPHCMDRFNRKSSRFIPEWNLVVPPVVYELTFEEELVFYGEPLDRDDIFALIPRSRYFGETPNIIGAKAEKIL